MVRFSQRPIVVALSVEEAEAVADLLAQQFNDRGFRDLSEWLYTEVEKERNR